ncbi:type IV secretory system conjugative DNA transfer family protein [Marinobacter nanhaiticus]|nr:TraM recognition domain-containing protein [Marinobacter nanhaiticus]
MEILRIILDNANPWVALSIAAVLGVFTVTLTGGAVRQTDEKTPIEILLVSLRRLALILLILVIPCFFLAVYGLAKWHLGSDANRYMESLYDQLTEASTNLWWSLIVVAVIPPFLKLSFERFITPQLSAFWRRFSLRQSADNLSDIRVENQRLKPQNFDPRTYYKNDQMFLGMSQNGDPIYMADEDFLKTHAKILGPTQTGKGVYKGVVLDQAIRKGWGVWFFDLKPDKFIYDIMRESCEISGRPAPGILDLNGVGPGNYSPFIGGTIRDRRERLVKAFKMAATGTNADHFKLKERAIIDYLMPYWDGSLAQLKRLLEGKHSAISESKHQWIREEGGDIFEKVAEFMNLPPLLANRENSLDIKQTMDEGKVMYVRSHTKDTLVRAATIALVDEMVQITLQKPLPHPTLVYIDECRFIVTDSLADALATVLGNGMCMGLAYQSILDLMNIPDKSLNGPSIRAGIETNTRLTISHGSDDIETAQWVSGKTGTVQKTVTRMERLQRNKSGAEQWSDERTVGTQEEALITSNQVLSFPERVAMLKRPGKLAELLFTCWVPVKELNGIPARQSEIQQQFSDLKNGARNSREDQPLEPQENDDDPVPDFENDTPAQPEHSIETSTTDSRVAKATYKPLTDDEAQSIEDAAASILQGQPTQKNTKTPAKSGVDLSDLDDIEGI